MAGLAIGRLLGAVLLCAALLAPIAAEAQEAKSAVVREIIAVTNTDVSLKAMSDAVMVETRRGLQLNFPDTDPRAFEIMVEVMGEALAPLYGEAVERSAAAMEQNFSLAELKEILAFYQTSAGRKSMELMPALAAESFAWGQTRAMELLSDARPEIMRRLEAEGFDVR
jgi:uncharacterized protein